MRRRDVLMLAGGLAMSRPGGVCAQPTGKARRVGVIMALSEDSAEGKAWAAAIRQGLERRRWIVDQNIHIDFRFAGARGDVIAALAKDMVATQPEVILAQTTAVARAVQRETQSIPIVFVHVSDPIGAGLVRSLSQPSGNLTGVLHYEAGIIGKWLSMLKEIEPRMTRVSMLANPKTTAFDYFLRSAQAAAPALGFEIVPARVETPADMERAVANVTNAPEGGLLLPPDATTILHHAHVVELAARYRLPAVYALQVFVAAGGLMSYGTDQDAMFALAGAYIDRILRGAKASDIPVQAPTRYQTAVNLKAARSLGLTVPPGLLVAADEVVE
jgi:putative ABC transport system substrate-binding protein